MSSAQAILAQPTVEVVFVPGRPARDGRFALWRPGRAPSSFTETVPLVLAAGGSVRQRQVPVTYLWLRDALDHLVALPPGVGSSSAHGWAAAARGALHLIARGRILPTIDEDGHDAWRVGPLDAADVADRNAIADSLSPAAHATAIEGSAPRRVSSPRWLVARFWDGVADAYVRTAAAPAAAGHDAYAGWDPVEVVDRRDQATAGGSFAGRAALPAWLVATGSTAEAATTVGLRLEDVDLRKTTEGRAGSNGGAGAGETDPTPHIARRKNADQATHAGRTANMDDARNAGRTANPNRARDAGRTANTAEARNADGAGIATGTHAHTGTGTRTLIGEEQEQETAFRAVLEVASLADRSLVLDAAELWRAPDVVAARFGPAVEGDVLLALRRGARVWPPVGRLLDQARPDRLDLNGDEVAELLGPVADRLAGSGIEVRWPANVLTAVDLAPVVVSPTVGADRSSGLDMGALCEMRWDASIDGEDLTEGEIAQLVAAKRGVVRLRGKWVRADPQRLARLQQSKPLTAGEALAAALSGELVVDGEEISAAVQGPLADLGARLADHAARDYWRPPAGLRAELRPYQRDGAAWLAEMADLGLGGVLADDMGLGKTIQFLAVHLARLEAAGRPQTGPGDRPTMKGTAATTDATATDDRSPTTGPAATTGRTTTTGTVATTTGVSVVDVSEPGAAPSLVVCPVSVLGNWARESARFVPDVPVVRYHGADRSLDHLPPGAIVLTTYGVARREVATLADHHWGLIAADEAQAIKNPLSRTAKAMRAIPADARFALTGTPVENRLVDLWALLDWTTPGLLGPLDRFRREVSVPVERDQDPDAAASLARLVRPFLLRRRKADPDIAPDLPPKTETDRVVPLTTEQVTLYAATVEEVLAQVEAAEGMSRRGLVLKLLTGLKQVCNHPAQYLKQPGPTAGRSGKLDAVTELIDTITSEGESVLVFTQFVAMAKLLTEHLSRGGRPVGLLHGGVSAAKRQDLVDRFQAGEFPVFVISVKAGGTGLNLTRATHVVHYDRWWNPAVEDQASDRAWRIGQDRPVQVHRMICEGTVEDKIAGLLTAKRSIADAVVTSGEGWVSELADDDLRLLVALGADAAAGVDG